MGPLISCRGDQSMFTSCNDDIINVSVEITRNHDRL